MIISATWQRPAGPRLPRPTAQDLLRGESLGERQRETTARGREWLAISLRVGAVLLCATAAGCASFFFHPSREPFRGVQVEQLDRQDVCVTTPDGLRLHGWLVRPPAKPLGTILFFHGNAENITTHVHSVLWLVSAGYQVMLLDYRGYGMSEGQTDLDGVHTDALAAMDAVFTREGVDPERVAVLGQSLGGSVAVYAVANSPHGKRVRLVMVDSAFAGYRRIFREKLARLILAWPLQYPLSLFLDDRYSAERWIRSLSPTPVLLLHGGRDAIVPVRHAEILHELAGEPKGLWIVQDAGHIQAFGNADLRLRLLELLKNVMAGPQDPALRGTPEEP